MDHSAADRELLIRTVLEVVQERRGTHIDGERDRGQCFSCGFLGHGVNRCPRLDRYFPYKTPGWSVDMRNGEYRASRITGEERDLTWGKRGMVRAGGSASLTISDSNTPDPGGGHRPAWKRPKDDTHGPRWTPDVHGFPVLGSLTPAEKGPPRSCSTELCSGGG